MNARTIPTRLATIATVAAAIAAAAGVFVGNLYRDTPYWIEQARGTDLATLFVAVPVLAAGLWAMRRGSESAWLVVIAGLLYLAYNYAIFAFSVAMNPLTSLYIAIAGLATWSLLAGAMDGATVSAGQVVAERMARRTSAVVLVGVALLFTLLWLGQLGGSVASGTVPPDIARAGIPTNPVYALDLAFFLPLAAVAGLGLLRRGRAGAYAFTMLIWVPLMSAGILGGFVSRGGRRRCGPARRRRGRRRRGRSFGGGGSRAGDPGNDGRASDEVPRGGVGHVGSRAARPRAVQADREMKRCPALREPLDRLLLARMHLPRPVLEESAPWPSPDFRL